MKCKKCKDHLGNEFESIQEMCDHYNINRNNYNTRIKNGWSTEKALTTPVNINFIYDHLGNKYKSIREICNVYNISEKTFRLRMRSGWDIKKILTFGCKKQHMVQCVDHLGNEYVSIKDMCRSYGINTATYRQRIARGWDIEKALTYFPIESRVKCVDHLGNKYASKTEMCNKYGIPVSSYNKRIKKGLSVEQALTTTTKEISDHLGNKYSSITEMCNHYNISRELYTDRIARGWDVEKALTLKTIEFGSYLYKTSYDHLGNRYKSVKEMCMVYKINTKTYLNRIKRGLSVEQALTTPTKHRNINKYIDPVTLEEHDDLKYYIDKYNLPYTTTKNLRNYIQWYNIIRAIGISFILRKGTNNFNVTKYDLTVVKRIKKGKDVFECYINNPDGSKTFRIMSYDMIDEYCLNKYKESMKNVCEENTDNINVNY